MEEQEVQEQAEVTAPAEEPIPSGDSSNKILLYGMVFLWSFFIMFLLMYYFAYRNRMQSVPPTSEAPAPATMAQEKSHEPVIDPLHLEHPKGNEKEPALFDSSDTAMDIPSAAKGSDDLATLQAEVQALINESRRRQTENDELWTELIAMGQEQKTNRDTVFALKSTPKDTLAEPPASNTISAAAEDIAAAGVATPKDLQQEDRKAAIANSAKLYSAMKPKTAANILTQLDDEMVADILSKIKMRQTAKILESMSVERATKICRIMAEGGSKAK